MISSRYYVQREGVLFCLNPGVKGQEHLDTVPRDVPHDVGEGDCESGGEDFPI